MQLIAPSIRELSITTGEKLSEVRSIDSILLKLLKVRCLIKCTSMVKQVFGEVKEYNVNTYQMFIAIKQANDGIKHSVPYKILPQFDISAKLVLLIESTIRPVTYVMATRR